MRDRTKRPAAGQDEPIPGEGEAAARHEAPMKLTKEDIRKLVEVFLILDRWKREDDEKDAKERAT